MPLTPPVPAQGFVVPPVSAASVAASVAPLVNWYWASRFMLTIPTPLRYANFAIGVSGGNIQVCVLRIVGTTYTRVMGGAAIACPTAGNVSLDLGATVLPPGEYAFVFWCDNTTVTVSHVADSRYPGAKHTTSGNVAAFGASGTWGGWGGDRAWLQNSLSS